MFDIVGVGTPGRITLFVGDPDLAKEVINNRHDFPKPTEDYKILEVFGPNIVSTNGEDWRRYRRITAPQFSEKNNKLVHDETVHTMHDLFRFWDRRFEKTSSSESSPTIKEGEFEINFTATCTQIALHVFAAAGYGKRFTWEEHESIEKMSVQKTRSNSKHVMSFQQATHGTVDYLLAYLVLPKWVYRLPIPFVQNVDTYVTEYKDYINDFIAEARQLKTHSDATGTTDNNTSDNLLTSLVDASATGEDALKEDELLGNIFVMLVAGHETTANTIAWALAMLAIDQERQEKLHEHIKSVVGDRDPTYKDYNDLTYVVAIMNETLRLYPPVANIPKKTPINEPKQLGPYLLPANTHINLNLCAIQRHPKLWGPDGNEFKPERFLDGGSGVDAAKAAWMPFSEGARACLGKRFAQVEFVCALAMLAQKYRWRVPGYEAGEEVPKEIVERMLKATERLTTVPANEIKLVVSKR
ncbi:hypothetical protein HK102_000556 [Quaeritorhiza haematococci]|nr:hypothetical protein HK102_000556 [Quaeritorhiza haematococci]